MVLPYFLVVYGQIPILFSPQTLACRAAEGFYFACEFPSAVLGLGLHTMALELLTIMVALKLWVKRLAYMRVSIYCDNTESVCTLNSVRTRDPFMLRIMREIAMLCASSNCHIRAIHLPGSENRLADKLYRAHLETHDVASLVV